MIYLELFWSFLKIGFTSFGGLSMVPLISSEMLSHGWMTAAEVADIVAIAEMTPGPLGLNCATFAGIRTAGLGGAIAANLGVLSPTFTLALAAAIFFAKFKEAKVMQSIMAGVRPACFALIVGLGITLCLSTYHGPAATVLPSLAISLLDCILLLKWRVSIPKVIFLNAALGLLFFGLLPSVLGG